MRVLFISNYFPPYEVGGYEQLCRDVRDLLTERGHTTAVLTSARKVDVRRPAEEAGVYRQLRLAPDFESRLSPAAQFFLTRRGISGHNRRCLRKVVREFEPDVISIWNLQGLPRTLAMEAETQGGPGVAYWLAGYSPAEPDEFWQYWGEDPKLHSAFGPAKGVFRRLALKMLRAERGSLRLQMRHIGVVSEYLRMRGIRSGVLPENARVIYNGVETDEFYRPVPEDYEGRLVLIQAGRVSDDKGVHTSIEAVAELANAYGVRNVHLYIAGAGPQGYLNSLRSLSQSAGITDLVTFVGQLPRSAIPDLFRRCHVLLLSTPHQEPFARVVLEAMTSGLAVVATLTGGTGELVRPEDTGLTFRAGDCRDLARQILRLMAEPALRVRLATTGQRMVMQDFTLERMADRIEGLHQEAYDDR